MLLACTSLQQGLSRSPVRSECIGGQDDTTGRGDKHRMGGKQGERAPVLWYTILAGEAAGLGRPRWLCRGVG